MKCKNHPNNYFFPADKTKHPTTAQNYFRQYEPTASTRAAEHPVSHTDMHDEGVPLPTTK
jgi:hypothetical protein